MKPKRFKRIVKFDDDVVEDGIYLYWITIGILILPFWIYNLFKYDDSWFLLAYIPLLLFIIISSIVIYYQNREIYYEEIL